METATLSVHRCIQPQVFFQRKCVQDNARNMKLKMCLYLYTYRCGQMHPVKLAGVSIYPFEKNNLKNVFSLVKELSHKILCLSVINTSNTFTPKKH